MRDHILCAISYPVRILVGLLAYRSTVSTLYAQGSGRYSDDEVVDSKQEIWDTLDKLLAVSKAKAGKGPFWILGGSHPTEADATLFGFIVSVLTCTAYVRPLALVIYQEH